MIQFEMRIIHVESHGGAVTEVVEVTRREGNTEIRHTATIPELFAAVDRLRSAGALPRTLATRRWMR